MLEVFNHGMSKPACINHQSRVNALVILMITFLLVLGVQSPAQIFIVNAGSGTISKYSLAGAAENTSFISGLSSPTGIAVGGGFIYVAQENGTVRKYTTGGALVNANLITGLYLPWGLAVSGSDLYVANAGGPNSTVSKYTTSGTLLNASLITGLDNPTGLALSGNNLYVSEWSAGVVGKYTTSGATVNTSFAGGFTYPGGVAVDDAGFVYISSLYGGVRKYSSAGALINGSLIANSYNSGIGLAYDGQGSLLVANNFGGGGGNIIGKYTTTGAVVDADFITGLNNPVAIAVLVPEPTSAALLGVGLVSLLTSRRRKM
jgi:hypothetical protein